jgi:hypothetical protein
MKTLKLVTFITPILLAQLLVAQANMDVPVHPVPASPQTDCHSTSKVLPDGSLQFTDCSGARTPMKRESIASAGTGMAGAAGAGEAVPAKYPDPQTNEKYQEAVRAGFDYQTYSYAHAKRTFEWQYWSGQIIFWIAMLLVGAGLLFSAVQFYLGFRHPLVVRTGGSEPQSAPAEAATSEFEATLHGIKLKSSVLGLLILAMSMVFFYLYLKYVYPITNVS